MGASSQARDRRVTEPVMAQSVAQRIQRWLHTEGTEAFTLVGRSLRWQTASMPSDGPGLVAAIIVDDQKPTRLAFIDNIRWTMIILVLSMHASDTYSPFGNWYYTDRGASDLATAITFGVYQSFLQAFFMALLFLIAGYFAASALGRKGLRQFSLDRLVRLGLPTLLYMLVIGPLTQYFLSRTWGTGGFGHQWLVHLGNGEWLSETGPMWFCAALLLFSLSYALLRQVLPVPERAAVSRPSDSAIVGFIAIMALTTFVVRIAVPESVAILNMHPGDFPQYILMFAAGIAASRGRWFERLPQSAAIRWAAISLVLAIPLFVVLIFAGGALQGDTSRYGGGFNQISAGKSLWEALVCVGMSFGLLALYRRCFDRQGWWAKLLSDNAFAVYLIHPPVIIALALLLHALPAAALFKAVLLTVTAAVATFALSALVFRQIPLLQRIL
jgi:glucans biosynthesis protein C